MKLGERIQLIRGAKSRELFSSRTGVSKNTLVNYEKGERTPDADFLNKLLQLYPDINPTWLLTGEGTVKREEMSPPAYSVGININKESRPWVEVLLHVFKSGDKNKIEAVKAQLRALGPMVITTGFTRADIFKQSAFAIGEVLPDDPGQLDGILVLEVDATANMKTEALLCSLIECYDQKPFRNLEQRSRQLTNLLVESFKTYDYISIVIRNAHNLTESTIRNLLPLHEVNMGFGPSPQIVMVGNILELNKKIDAIGSIKQRAMIF